MEHDISSSISTLSNAGIIDKNLSAHLTKQLSLSKMNSTKVQNPRRNS